MPITKLTPERKLKYLQEWLHLGIDMWPAKPKPFVSWFDSVLDKKEHKGRKEMAKHQKTKCRYCGRSFDANNLEKTKDHIVAQSKGGLNKKENRVQCCYDCNQWKDDKTLEKWLSELKYVIKKGKIRPPYNEAIVGTMIGHLKQVIEEAKQNNSKISIYKVK